jgi:hypothetical protein
MTICQDQPIFSAPPHSIWITEGYGWAPLIDQPLPCYTHSLFSSARGNCLLADGMIDHLTFVTRHNAALWQTSWALIERLGVVEGLSLRLFVGSLRGIIRASTNQKALKMPTIYGSFVACSRQCNRAFFRQCKLLKIWGTDCAFSPSNLGPVSMAFAGKYSFSFFHSSLWVERSNKRAGWQGNRNP